jgi:hypothetical protein
MVKQFGKSPRWSSPWIRNIRAIGGREEGAPSAGGAAGASASCFWDAERDLDFAPIGECLETTSAGGALKGQSPIKTGAADGAPALRFAQNHEATRRHRPHGVSRKFDPVPPWGESPTRPGAALPELSSSVIFPSAPTILAKHTR